MGRYQSTAAWPAERPLRRLAAIGTVVSLAFVAISLIFLAVEVARGWIPLGDPSVAQTLVAVAIFALTFPLLGWVILRRQPRNRLGWIYLMIGFFQALNMLATSYSTVAYRVASGDMPMAATLSWIAVWAWVPGFTLFCTLGILLFPTGRLLSPRWWPVVALTAVALVLLLVPTVVMWSYRGLPLERVNALNLPPPPDPAIDTAFAIQGVGQLVLLIAMAGSVAGLGVRFRRSVGVEREQLKWFTYAAILDLLLLVAWTMVPLDPLIGALSAFLLASLPIAIAVAILRYHLYEIDRIVSRTIGYATVTGLLVVVFAGAILLFQSVLAPMTGGNTIAVAASTLVVAALFQPLRRRVQSRVDRRFNRTRYDAERVLAALSGLLREDVDLGRLRADVTAAVERTVQPISVALWLRH